MELTKGQRFKSNYSADYFEIDAITVHTSTIKPGTVNVVVAATWYDEDDSEAKKEGMTGNGIAAGLEAGDITPIGG